MQNDTIKKASDIPELSFWQNPPPIHLPIFKKAIRHAWRRHFGCSCPSCSCTMLFDSKFRNHKHYATIDHIIARGLGGTNMLENLQLLCRKCNNKKSLDEYHKKHG